MNTLFFWKNWAKEYRYSWFAIGGVFIFSLLFLWFSYFRGADGVIDWQKLQEQKVLETTVHQFQLGPFRLEVPAELYIIYEYYNGSSVKPNTSASYLFLTVMTISIVVMLSVITTIQRFWYYVAMGLFIVVLVSFRFEVLGLFGFFNKGPVIAVLALYLIPSFYFQRFKPTTPLVIRFATFFIITLLLAVSIAFFSSVELPFYHLTLTGFTPGIVITIIFIFMVAHEIIAAFVYVVGQGTSKTLKHLSLISVIYLANVLITCLHEIGYIKWDFLYINLYLLLTVSALLGIWGFRQREPLYENILSFYPFGALLFLSLGAICFVTTAQLLGNANDPGLRIVRDAIIFSHTGYGFIFLMYLFSNFIAMFANNLPVYKVLYQPNRMPYFTYRFAGLIAVLGFVFSSNWREYVYHGLGAFYNTAGDMYSMMDNAAYAESFYNQGRLQAFQNNRSNYALGTLRAERFNFEEAHNNFAYANARRPTEYSLTNAGNVYAWENRIDESIATYQEGLSLLPSSAVLQNNLGLAYAKAHNIDSAVHYFSLARESGKVKTSAETNFFAMAAQEFVPLKADSVLRTFKSENPATLSNALAHATVFQHYFQTDIDPLAKIKLDLYAATYLNNYIIKNISLLDTTFIHRADKIASDSVNADYHEALKASLAFAYYHQGNISRALSILGELAYISQHYQGKFNYIMGLWALEQYNPALAARYFSHADTYDYKEARFYHAIALTEAGKPAVAYAAWDSVRKYGEHEQRIVAQRIQRILTMPSTEVMKLSDSEKYQFCRYRIKPQDSIAFNRIANAFDNPNYKAQALLDMSRKYLEADQLIPAIRTYQRIAGLELTDKRLYNDSRFFELTLLAYKGDIPTLAKQINKGIVFDAAHQLEKMYYTALISEASGDIEKANRHYKVLATYNPYYEDGVIAAYRFFRKQNPESLAPYSILAEAVHINAESLRLWKVYYEEAVRMGLDDYAASAARTIQEWDK